MGPDDLDALMSAIPTELGWGLIVALLVRGFVTSIPKIVDSVTRAMTERATAQRLAQQVLLTEAETERDDGQERRALAERVTKLETKLREQEASCAEEVRSAHAMHQITSDRLTTIEAQHIKCERALKDQSEEMAELRASIRSMR